MSRLHLADNTVFVNFGHISRMDLLERLLNGRGSWSATVEIECAASAEFPGMESLADAPRFMGPPLTLDSDTEMTLASEIRERLRIPGDPPEKHWGESESLAIISARPLDAHFVTDDTAARTEARRLQIELISTASLLILATKVEFITPQQCWDYFLVLESHDRFLPDRPESFAALLAICGFVT